MASSSSDAPPVQQGPLLNIPHNVNEVEEGDESENESINDEEAEQHSNKHDTDQVPHDEFPNNNLTQDRSLVVDLHAHLNDSTISDVVLVGTDNNTVVAVRSILAMRSNFFKTLFFGHFCESISHQVKLGYSSLVIKAVVEYCYTDEIKTAFENLDFEETARAMVGLVAAGNYFELGGLQSRANRLTCLMMDEYPALACAVLDEVSINNETSELGRVALGIIRLRTESSLLPPNAYGLGVQSLGAAAMEQVIADTEIQTQEFLLFQCLKKWAEYEAEGNNAAEDRREMARRMARHIDFSRIEPSALSTTVQESGLVPTDLLLKAYRTQALRAERMGLAFGRMRSTLNQAASGTIMVQGAGLTAVNGMYTSCNETEESLRHTQRGTLPGFGNGVFVLQTWVLQDDSKKWFLSFHQGNTTLDLYSSPVLSDTDPPPMQKWSSVMQSHEKIRQLQNRSCARRKPFDSSSFHGNDDDSLGDPPPICIWLPNDSSTRSA